MSTIDGAVPSTPSSDNRASKPTHEPRPVKIICIGAGASGLLLAYKLQRSFESFELVIYEKNEDVSGTWLENTYPGCACDLPAHVYTYSFEPHADWTSVYAGSAEIRHYFASFCKKYELYKYIKLRHQVTGAFWDHKQGKWELEIMDLDGADMIGDSCDILINAAGVLNAWRWPAIPGLEDYKGELVHTANWDASIDLRGKHVGLIGNGSSGIQVLPAISPIVRKVTTFIRAPTWVSPAQAIQARKYPEEERRKYMTDPQAHIVYRKQLETNINQLFPMFIADSEAQKINFERLKTVMRTKLQNKALEDLVIPTWPVGCRRMTPGVNYLETLGSDKVEVVFGEIERITEGGCVSANNGLEYPVDVLICATGFDSSYRPRFPLVGASGKNLADVWAQEPKAYLGIAAHDFPNYFMFVGPNSPAGNGPLIIAMEAQADYMLKMINRWQTENIHSFSPKLEAVEDFIEFKDQFMKSTVWNYECRSWYKTNSISGKVTALWPGSTLHYLEALSEPRYEDWNIKYTGNRFSFFGNGLSRVETDRTADWAYYIRNEDNGPYLSRVKHMKIVSSSGSVTRENGETKGRYN